MVIPTDLIFYLHVTFFDSKSNLLGAAAAVAATSLFPSTNRDFIMAHRTHNAVKWQTVAVESALFSPDVVFLLAALLDSRDLCQGH